MKIEASAEYIVHFDGGDRCVIQVDGKTRELAYVFRDYDPRADGDRIDISFNSIEEMRAVAKAMLRACEVVEP